MIEYFSNLQQLYNTLSEEHNIPISSTKSSYYNYVIFSQQSYLTKQDNFFYLGKSSSEDRFYQHLNLLRNKKHYNYKLQTVYNSLGEKDLIFEKLVFLYSDEDSCSIETLAIEKTFSNNFNILSKSKSFTPSSIKRIFQLEVPSLTILNVFPSLREASRQQNVSVSSLGRCARFKVVNNFQPKTCGGYCWIYESDYSSERLKALQKLMT